MKDDDYAAMLYTVGQKAVWQYIFEHDLEEFDPFAFI